MPVTRHPHFVLNGVASATPGWDCPNPWELRKPPPKRYANLPIPRTNGRLARRSWFDEVERDLVLNIFEGLDADGAPATLDENLATLEAAWYEDPEPQILTLNLSETVSYAGPVQVVEFDWREKSPTLIRAVLTVCIPAGRLEIVP